MSAFSPSSMYPQGCYASTGIEARINGKVSNNTWPQKLACISFTSLLSLSALSVVCFGGLSIAVFALATEESLELAHHSHAQHEAVEYGHAPIEGAQQTVAFMGGRSERSCQFVAQPCQGGFLCLDLLLQGCFLLHQLFQRGGDCRRRRAKI